MRGCGVDSRFRPSALAASNNLVPTKYEGCGQLDLRSTLLPMASPRSPARAKPKTLNPVFSAPEGAGTKTTLISFKLPSPKFILGGWACAVLREITL